MRRWLSFTLAFATILLVASLGQAQTGGQINNEIHVIAEEGTFQLGGSGKVAVTAGTVTVQQVFNFLDSAGAMNIWQIFPDFDRADTLTTNREGDTVRLIDLSKYYGIEFSDSVSWEDLDSAWQGSDAFKIASQAGYSLAHDYYVNDPQYWLQWYLWPGLPGSPNVEWAWHYTRGNPSVKVCVIDDGIDYNHNDLSSRITAGYVSPNRGVNMLPTPLGGVECHGTSCAGIVAAITNNAIGIAGVDWHCQLFVARAATYPPLPIIFGDSVWFRDDDVAPCVDWATRNNVDVITMSFGAIDDNFFERVGHDILFGNVEAAALYNAWQKGVLLIASKGNDNSDGFNFPSDLETVMGIGACDLFGGKASFSNWGSAVDVVANGTDGYSTAVGNTYQSFAGTSMSSPVAAGVASLIKAHKPDLTADEIEQIMELTAKDRGAAGWDDEFGWGVLKADSAMRFIANNQFYRKQAVGGARQMVQGQHQHTFRNSGGLSSGTYFVETYKYVSHFDFPEYRFSEAPKVLYRFRGAKGWSASNPNEEFAHMQVVPGTLTTTGCDVETYAYLIKYNILGQAVNEWWPCDNPPCENAPDIKFKITVAGKPHVAAATSFTVVPLVVDALLEGRYQAVRLQWTDPNSFESGWVIQRKIADSTTWQTLDTLEPVVGDARSYNDSTFVGSETYTYRVWPLPVDETPQYSPEVTVTAKPRWPRTFTGAPVMASSCFAIPAGKVVAAKTDGGTPPDTLEEGECPTNMVRLYWSAPAR